MIIQLAGDIPQIGCSKAESLQVLLYRVKSFTCAKQLPYHFLEKNVTLPTYQSFMFRFSLSVMGVTVGIDRYSGKL